MDFRDLRDINWRTPSHGSGEEPDCQHAPFLAVLHLVLPYEVPRVSHVPVLWSGLRLFRFFSLVQVDTVFLIQPLQFG
jgi:hypothetical protein